MFARKLVTPAQALVLEERARYMRIAPTRSKEWLWRCLSGSNLGVPFRRQLVIGPYVVDFACTKARLVVDVDGASHEGRERHDVRRDRVLRELGWAVLRVGDEQAVHDLGAVLKVDRSVTHRAPV